MRTSRLGSVGLLLAAAVSGCAAETSEQARPTTVTTVVTETTIVTVSEEPEQHDPPDVYTPPAKPFAEFMTTLDSLGVWYRTEDEAWDIAVNICHAFVTVEGVQDGMTRSQIVQKHQRGGLSRAGAETLVDAAVSFNCPAFGDGS